MKKICMLTVSFCCCLSAPRLMAADEQEASPATPSQDAPGAEH